MSYTFSITTADPVHLVVDRVTQALAEEGFGVLTRVDVQYVLAKRLGIGRRPYVILGAYCPALVRDALDHDPDAGALLPCNVIVRQAENGEIVVSFTDPVATFGLARDDALDELAHEARRRLQRVRDALMPGQPEWAVQAAAAGR